MKKILNPFLQAGHEAYNCFGCSPANDHGLHLEFWQDGEEIVAVWEPDRVFEGWAGILHGGIQVSLMDEAAAWLVFVLLKTAGVTSGLTARYLKPVYITKGPIKIRAALVSSEKKTALIKCTLEDGNGILCAEAEITYFCLPESMARIKYNYPGVDAFFEK